MSPKTDLSCHPQYKRHDCTSRACLNQSWGGGAPTLSADSPVKSCDYSRVAVVEAWVGEQEVAAAAAAAVVGQYKGEGPGQTGMR